MLHYNCVCRGVFKQGENCDILTGELDCVYRALTSYISGFIGLSCVRCKSQKPEDFPCETLAEGHVNTPFVFIKVKAGFHAKRPLHLQRKSPISKVIFLVNLP